MAELVVFGVPAGWDSSECRPETNVFLGNFYTTGRPGVEFKTIRHNDTMFYVMLVRENPGAIFTDADGRAGSFFGIALGFDKQYVSDASRVHELLRTTYDNYVRGQIIEELPNGNRRYKIAKLRVPGDRVGWHVANGMTAILKANPEIDRAIFTNIRPLPPLQHQAQRG